MDLNLSSEGGGDWESQICDAISRALDAKASEQEGELRQFRTVLANAPDVVHAKLGMPLSEDRLLQLLDTKAFETAAREFADVEQIQFMVSRRSDAFYLAVITVSGIDQDFVGDASTEAFAFAVALARAGSFIATGGQNLD